MTAYPERIGPCVEEGLIEAVLAILQHQNIDICQLCVTLLFELCEKELNDSNPDLVTKIIKTYSENAIWSLLLKVIDTAKSENRRKQQ